MGTWLDPIQHRLCSRPRCQLPIAGVGEAYGLCDGHGHEERNRRLAERDAKARTATQRPIVRGLTVTPVDRPLSAIVGARPTPPPIQPSAATVAAKEPSMAKPLTLKPNADALPPTVCRIAGCDAKGHARGLCSPHYAAARANRSIEALALPSTQTKRPPKPVDDQRITTEAGLLAALGTLPPPARGIVERLCTEAPKLRQDLADAVARAEATKRARQEQEAAERELLEVSADVAKALGLDLESDYLPARARNVMEQIATLDKLRAERDAAVARAEAATERSRDTAATNADLRKVIVEIANKVGVDGDAKFEDVLKAIDGLNQKLANQARANTLNLIADQPSLRRSAMEAIMDGRDEAVVRAEAAEKTLAIVLESLCADLGIEQSDDAEWVLGHVTDLKNAEREGLDESIAVREALGIDPSGDYDLIARAREVMAEIADVRAKLDAADEVAERLRRERAEAVASAESTRNVLDNHIARLAGVTDGICEILGIDKHPSGSISWVLERLRERIEGDAAKLVAANEFEDDLRAEHAKTLPWLVAAKECAAALGASTPDALLAAVKALSLDQHPPATIGGDDVTLQWIGPPILPEPKPHRVAQAGGHDLGVLVGYIDPNGLFRVTEGPKKGAVYGCLYRAEPMDRPVLGEPTPDRDVWVRTSIDEVTPHNIHTADGGRFRRSEWGPARFAPVAKSTPSSAAVGEDDIPF